MSTCTRTPAEAQERGLLLDSLRIASALVVFAHHCGQFRWPALYDATARLAHGAVIVFFVLSGYVIAWSTLGSGRDARHYAAARLSRLYSVVLPALALTAALYLAGARLHPALYASYTRGPEATRYALTTFFAQNLWFLNASPPSNSPFWSLSYEFWYYAMFGLVIFARGRAAKVAAGAAAALVAGPCILLLMPCWLVGVAAYLSVRRGREWPRWMAPGALALMLGAMLWLPQWPDGMGRAPFWFSGAFATDWLTAFGAGGLILCAGGSRAAGPGIRAMADLTFPLYLCHFPVILFATAIFPPGRGMAGEVAIAAGVLAVVIGLGVLLERRRHAWRALFERLLGIRRQPR